MDSDFALALGARVIFLNSFFRDPCAARRRLLTRPLAPPPQAALPGAVCADREPAAVPSDVSSPVPFQGANPQLAEGGAPRNAAASHARGRRKRRRQRRRRGAGRRP